MTQFVRATTSDLIQMQKVPSCSPNKTNINRKFWFNTSVYSFSVKHGYFYGLRDRYDALVGAFHREDKKEIDRLEAEKLKDIELNLRGWIDLQPTKS